MLMNLLHFEKILENEPKYRTSQARKAIFSDLIESWHEATSLPNNIRDLLSKECPIEIKSKLFISNNKKAVKALIFLSDEQKIETVLMRKDSRNTVCVSTQVGCPMGCKFCATGDMGFKRNLSASEIIEQIILFARYLKPQNEKVTNIVFMGMGEPFLNYDNVLESIRYLNQKDSLNIGARRFSISTVGLTDGINRFANENLEVNLAISLHAPSDEIRSNLMPINNSIPIAELISSAKNYIRKTRRKVMFEYLMIDGVNDSPNCAEELSTLLKGMLCMVNLIPYNETDKFKPSSKTNIECFKNVLLKNKIEVIQRYSFGKDISAACGQLATS